MISISDKKKCCGCTACVSICAHGAIILKPDELGYLYPSVDVSKCVDCHLCEKVCPYLKPIEKSAKDSIALAARLKNEEDLFRSQSGGAFWGIAKQFIKEGVVYGAAFDNDLNVRHIRVTNTKELIRLCGSKYVQSELGDIFKQVRYDLQKGRKVLFSGTGCQLGGLLSFIPQNLQEKLYTIDLICHAVPSPALWRDNLKYISSVNKSYVISANTRDNKYGWTPCKATYTLRNGRILNDDSYLQLWFKHYSVRDSCSNCLYTTISRHTDLTIGDFWGWEKYHTEWNDEKGISLILLHSSKGQQLFNLCKEDFYIKDSNITECIQPQLVESINLAKNRSEFISDYKNKGYEFVLKKYLESSSYNYSRKDKFIRVYHHLRSIFFNKASRLTQTSHVPFGAVLMLHRIDTPDENGIWFNQHLKMSPKAIEEMVKYARSRGCEFVSLDNITQHRRIWEQPRKLIAITLDDGYRDNFVNGTPIFRKLNIPFCIYICTKMIEGKMLYWWEILEKIILENEKVVLADNREFDSSSKPKKEQAFLDIREIILKSPQKNLQDNLETLFKNYIIDYKLGNDNLGLTWQQIKELLKDSLCTIGNHTYSHNAFTGCTDDEIKEDIARAAREMRKHTGFEMKHFAFPFGEATAVSQHDIELVKNLGFRTSATTKDGLVCYGTDPLEIPRVFVTEHNWMQVIDRIADYC